MGLDVVAVHSSRTPSASGRGRAVAARVRQVRLVEGVDENVAESGSRSCGSRRSSPTRSAAGRGGAVAAHVRQVTCLDIW